MKRMPDDNEQILLNSSNLNEQQMQSMSKYYTGIDWTSLLFRLLEKIHWILLTAVIGAVLVASYVHFRVTPIYQATSKLYIAGSETSISLSDLQLGSTLAKDYQEVFKIWHIHEMVDEKLDLDYSYAKLGNMVSVSVPEGSHVLYIRINSPDPAEAQKLADTYAEVVQDYIANKMELRRPQLLEKAQLPISPISPNVRNMVMTGFAGSGFAAAALVAFLFLLDDKIRTDEDVEKASNLAVLGVIPRQSAENHSEIPSSPLVSPLSSTDSSGRSAVIQGNIKVDYSASEAVNMICSSITFAGKTMKEIAVTSSEAGNGKTFVALQTAAEMARRGKKTLLIDADLRKSVMQARYNIELYGGNLGLAHYLSGQCGLDSAIYATNIPNLFLLPVGRNVATPLPLLTNDDFSQMMQTLAQDYDFVLVDTPPIGMVVDGAEIAQRCDGSILVLEYNHTTIRSLRTMEKLLEQAGSPILGCVINKVAVKGLGKSHYYYYQYGAYEYSASQKSPKKSFLGFHLKKGSKKA